MTMWYNFKIKGVGLWDGRGGGAEVATFKRSSGGKLEAKAYAFV